MKAPLRTNLLGGLGSQLSTLSSQLNFSGSVGVGVAPADEGQEEDLDVEPDGPVFNIVEVVLRTGGEVGVAAEAVDLGPAGHAGFDDVARLVVRDRVREVGDVVRAFGARADEAHVAAEDVPVLREFVEVPAAHEGAEAEEAGVVARGALLRGVGRGGVGGHAAEFVEGEGAVVGADANLAEEDGKPPSAPR